MNVVFFSIVSIACIVAGWHQLHWLAAPGTPSPMEALTKAMIQSAADSVELALGLVGVMTLFLGLVKVAESGGLLRIIARLIRPIMVKLFPNIPPDHPAMGAMILNISANAMGLGNAATPFGIRAMQELDKLNGQPGTATDSMALFLAINTSSVTLLPTGVIALRAAAGSTDPAGILPTTLFATLCSTLVAVVAAKFYGHLCAKGRPPEGPGVRVSHRPPENNEPWISHDETSPYPLWVTILAIGALLACIPLAALWGRQVSPWVIPGLMLGFLLFGFLRKVRVYEVFVDGAKEGFNVAVKIIPYLVAILVAVGMFRSSGAMDLMVNLLGPLTDKIGLPAQALPMALLRPLSGSGAYGLLASIINDPSIGPDSYIGYLVSTLQGSTETTFYVIAIYFGAVQVKKIRHTLAAALTADLAGIVGAALACSFLL
ncbi:MAG: spore maturation protein [Deltaproteobacteria bacterium]|nr:MAG: spore maturation protein [Deltaproteobacteria bacterium]